MVKIIFILFDDYVCMKLKCDERDIVSGKVIEKRYMCIFFFLEKVNKCECECDFFCIRIYIKVLGMLMYF